MTPHGNHTSKLYHSQLGPSSCLYKSPKASSHFSLIISLIFNLKIAVIQQEPCYFPTTKSTDLLVYQPIPTMDFLLI